MYNDQLIIVLGLFVYALSILECMKISVEKRGDVNLGALLGVTLGAIGWLVMRYVVNSNN